MSKETKKPAEKAAPVAMTPEQMKAKNATAYAHAQAQGIELKHDPEVATEAQFMAALDGHRKETGKLERAQKYLSQAQAAAVKVKPHQKEKEFHHQNFAEQSQSRIVMAQMSLEMHEAVITGQKPVDNTESIERELQLGLNTAKVMYCAARPGSSQHKKTNLENLEGSRAAAVDAGIITGKECPKFAQEVNGKWEVAPARQKAQPPVEDGPKPEPQKEEKAQEKAEA